MKLVYTVKSFIKDGYRYLQSEIFKNAVEETKQAPPFGFDSVPTKNWIAVLSETMSNEDPVIIGYLNQNALSDLKEGESMIFNTDANGAIQGKIIMRNDATIQMLDGEDFAVRYTELEAAFNQLKSDFDNLVTTFNTHVHPGVTAGSASTLVTTTTGQSSEADISGAKVDEIKIP